ncbi:putative calcium-transporting ATPase 13, plasma membrane-type [Eucalyptus grandis]|uniref:putative calcium-transporting ATPase 13, plasma membrane-type n=1 Tax=Eucalyptus grandis TaxID=71139 RepID=UPI00192EDF6F|nr:putative calcium-transporting ATPase 13, plasma membrane-type [Eucalyptus grandis]
MITGDNIFNVKAIAKDCGILKPGKDTWNGAIVEGAEFRSYTPEERLQRVEKIQVMVRSSPFDKLPTVQCLKQKGHAVTITGDSMNDAPALKEANIGLSMGISGNEAAKECSDILTALTSALAITMVAALSSGSLPLTAVQLLWHPVAGDDPLVTNIMWRNLVAQASYEVTVLLILQFKGELLYVNQQVKNASIFNALILCQVFNLFNCRKLEEITSSRGRSDATNGFGLLQEG